MQMSKVRVHEYAKKVNKSSKEVIEQLAKAGLTVTNHMSTLDSDAVQKLDAVFVRAESRKPSAVETKKEVAPKRHDRPSPKSGQNSNQPRAQQQDRPQVNQQQSSSQHSEKQKNKGNQNRNMTKHNNNNNNNSKKGG